MLLTVLTLTCGNWPSLTAKPQQLLTSGDGRPSPFLTMEKIEIYKKVKEDYQVQVHKDHLVIENFGFLLNTSKHKNPYWDKHHTYLNSSEEFVKHYANKLARVSHHKTTMVIEKNGDKLSFKVFHYHNERREGVHYFKKVRNMSFFTLNLKTGVLYQGEIMGLHKKKKNRRIRTNYFHRNPFMIMSDALHLFCRPSNHQKEYKLLRDTFISQIPDFYLRGNKGQDIISCAGWRFYEFYLFKRGVSIPDNFYGFQQNGFDSLVPAKFFKKGKNKYIDSLMSFHGFGGDVIKKALHTDTTFTFNTLKSLINLVGITRVQQDYRVLMIYLSHQNDILIPHDVSWLSESEKKRIWYFVKNTLPRMTVIRDHIEFIVFLKKNGNNVGWKSKTYKDFLIEHKRLSDEVTKLKQGIFTRKYPEVFYSTLNKPITLLNKNLELITYSINLLSTQDEFHQESEHQQNCVKTYLTKPGSFVLSLRNGEDRATMEYHIKSTPKGTETRRVQSLGRFNQELDSSWDTVLNKVDEIVDKLIQENKYEMVLTKEKKDKVSTFKAVFDKNGFINWDNPLEINPDFDYFF